MTRLFVYDQREFPDPDPKLAVEDVRKQLAEFFPELTNADTREEKRGEDTLYTFSRRIGTKGRRRKPDIVAILRRVPAKDLRLFGLAAELLGERGEVAVDAAAIRQPEINLALAEVEGYVRATRQATETLLELAAG